MKLPTDECLCILLMINQHWFRLWLGAVRLQAIAWANVDPDHLMTSLYHGLIVLTLWSQCRMATILHAFSYPFSRKTFEFWFKYPRFFPGGPNISTLVQVMAWCRPGPPGGRLNIKMSSYQYRHPHVKDKTVLSLTWESPYLGKTVFILRRAQAMTKSNDAYNIRGKFKSTCLLMPCYYTMYS